MKRLSDTLLNIISECNKENSKKSPNIIFLLQSAIRLARLRNDFINLWWLRFEELNITDKEHKDDISREIIPHINREIYNHYHKIFSERLIEERSIEHYDYEKETFNTMALQMSIPEIVDEIENLILRVENIQTPDNLHPIDSYQRSQSNDFTKTVLLRRVGEMKKILTRSRGRIIKYISETEHSILYGKIQSDIFEENRNFVDVQLQSVCPTAYDKLIAIYNRIKSDNDEEWAQALTSCRRLLKDFADAIYPPKKDKVVCSDGSERVLGEEQYKNRLWQFVYENYKGVSSKVIKDELEYLCNRIDSLYDLSCKGVHASVNKNEVNQCVIYIYLLIGDILRIKAGNTATNFTSS